MGKRRGGRGDGEEERWEGLPGEEDRWEGVGRGGEEERWKGVGKRRVGGASRGGACLGTLL